MTATWRESPAAVERRRQHERELDRVGGSGTDAGQALLDKWFREDLENRRRSDQRIVQDGDGNE